MIKDKKHLIVGAGLSGICLAIQLVRRGTHVTIIDKGENFSSIIAAGMINPLVFRRMTKSWRVDEFLPYLNSFYAALEQETNSSFFYELPIRRLFSSEQERNFWLEKENNPAFQAYMHPVTEEDKQYDNAKNPFGSGRVKGSCFVDVHSFVEATHRWIQQHAKFRNELFDYNALDGLNYKNESFDAIIFCEGFENKNNPWFGELPLDHTKGQTLTIRATSLPDDVSLNRKCFVQPREKGTYKIGSTYEWHNSTTHITEEAKEEILDNLSYITDEKVEVLNQEAGIRPTTRDRRPLLGSHPQHPNYHIFNGLGAKGYMLAPLLSEEFVHYLEGNLDLDKEVNISRYFMPE